MCEKVLLEATVETKARVGQFKDFFVEKPPGKVFDMSATRSHFS